MAVWITALVLLVVGAGVGVWAATQGRSYDGGTYYDEVETWWTRARDRWRRGGPLFLAVSGVALTTAGGVLALFTAPPWAP